MCMYRIKGANARTERGMTMKLSWFMRRNRAPHLDYQAQQVEVEKHVPKHDFFGCPYCGAEREHRGYGPNCKICGGHLRDPTPDELGGVTPRYISSGVSDLWSPLCWHNVFFDPL